MAILRVESQDQSAMSYGKLRVMNKPNGQLSVSPFKLLAGEYFVAKTTFEDDSESFSVYHNPESQTPNAVVFHRVFNLDKLPETTLVVDDAAKARRSAEIEGGSYKSRIVYSLAEDLIVYGTKTVDILKIDGRTPKAITGFVEQVDGKPLSKEDILSAEITLDAIQTLAEYQLSGEADADDFIEERKAKRKLSGSQFINELVNKSKSPRVARV